MDSSGCEVFEYLAQPSTSTAGLSERKPSSSKKEAPAQNNCPTEKHTKGRKGRSRLQTAGKAVKRGIQNLISKVRPSVPDREPSTPGTDALETLFDYAQPSTSGAVLFERKPKINTIDDLDTHYKTVRILESGPNVSVYEGIRKWDGQKVTIKCLCDKNLANLPVCPMRRELCTMRKVQTNPPCNHVINLYDWFYKADDVIIVMECLTDNMSLHDYIQNSFGPITERAAKQILLQLAVSLHHCYNCDVSFYPSNFRDLSVNSDTLQLKIVGFGDPRFIVETLSDAVSEVSVTREMAMETALSCLNHVLEAFIKQIPPWKRLSRECRQLRRLLMERRQLYTLENVLDHPWFADMNEEERSQKTVEKGNSGNPRENGHEDQAPDFTGPFSSGKQVLFTADPE